MELLVPVAKKINVNNALFAALTIDNVPKQSKKLITERAAAIILLDS